MNGRPQHTCCGTIDGEPVPLEDGHRVLADARLEVVRRAAVEVGDGARGIRARPAARSAPPRRFQVDENVRRANAASGPRRWTPSTFSPTQRASRLRRPMFASGASGTPRRASRSVSLMSRLRRLDPRFATIAARARLFVSAMSTPAGQARVQIPQPEHRSTV